MVDNFSISGGKNIKAPVGEPQGHSKSAFIFSGQPVLWAIHAMSFAPCFIARRAGLLHGGRGFPGVVGSARISQ